MPLRSQSSFTAHSGQLAPRQASAVASSAPASATVATTAASLVFAPSDSLAVKRLASGALVLLVPASLFVIAPASGLAALTFSELVLAAAWQVPAVQVLPLKPSATQSESSEHCFRCESTRKLHPFVSVPKKDMANSVVTERATSESITVRFVRVDEGARPNMCLL
jgi:hypothetical protein